MDRSRLLSWSLGIALLSVIVSPFAFLFLSFVMIFSPWPPVGGYVVFYYGIAVGLPFALFAGVFRGSLKGTRVPRLPDGPMRHPRLGIPLFVIGAGFAVFVLVGFLAPFVGGGYWYSFTSLLYPLLSLLPASVSIYSILLYLTLPNVVISYLLFRWRARVMAIVLSSLVILDVLAVIGMFLLLAAAFS